MKKLLWALIAVSVSVNLWLLAKPSTSSSAVPSETSAVDSPGANKSGAGAKSPAAVAPTAADSAKRITTLVQTLVALDSRDPVDARNRLLAAGADEATVYAVIDGILRLRFYQGKRIAEIENIQSGWWRGNPGSTTNPNSPLWGKTVVDPVLEIAGYGPHDLKDFASRFDFLPPEKAQSMAKMAIDYFAMHMRFTDDNRLPANTAADLMMTERQRDVLSLLTPEERAEYDLRFSPAAEQNIPRFARMQATEQEFRAIMPLVERAQQETAALPRDQNYTVASLNLQQRTFDDLVAGVGYDRAVDYIWSGTNVIVRDPNNSNSLVLSTTSSSPRLMQLAAETGAEAAAIHYNTSRSPEEKRAALLALQQATQPKLDKILPPETRADTDRQALAWFDVLGKGEYVTLTPRSVGSPSTFVVQPTSVTAPVRGSLPTPPRLRAVK